LVRDEELPGKTAACRNAEGDLCTPGIQSICRHKEGEGHHERISGTRGSSQAQARRDVIVLRPDSHPGRLQRRILPRASNPAAAPGGNEAENAGH
jgi:hypothetical protein